LLDSGAVDSEHVQVAREVLEVLRRYAEIEMKEQQELSDADKELARRAVKIQYFFTQPFFVAEAYTEIPGEYVVVEETVKGFKELLEGHYEDLPDKAFYFVGGVNEAIAKAEKEEKEEKA
jgi:F-type H+/Na+-transporting ATPase subunit beta